MEDAGKGSKEARMDREKSESQKGWNRKKMADGHAISDTTCRAGCHNFAIIIAVSGAVINVIILQEPLLLFLNCQMLVIEILVVV